MDYKQVFSYQQRKIGFLLLDDYTMFSFANAIEPFRMANELAEQLIYQWHVTSFNDYTTASNRLQIKGNCVSSLFDCDIVFVCAGSCIGQKMADEVTKLLQQLAQAGCILGGICHGVYVLAYAGLLNGYKAAIHGNKIASVGQMFPDVQFNQNHYLIDKDRYTCTGGTAPLEMVLKIIHLHHGREFINALTLQLTQEQGFVLDDKKQFLDDSSDIHASHDYVVKATNLMQSNIEEPIALHEIASLIGISLRQMERLFSQSYGYSPAQYYLRLRLRRARELLSNTNMPIMEVTVASGFSTSSHFCKTFKGFYGYSPSDERRRFKPMLAAA